MRGVFADLLGESGIVVQGRNNGRVRGTPRRRPPAWPSQFGDFEVSVPARGSDRGWPRGQTETVENLASGGRILNSRQNRIRPPQRGHSSTSTAKILAISWDQL